MKQFNPAGTSCTCILITALVLLGTLYVTRSADAQTTKPQTPAGQIVEASNTLGFDLYQRLTDAPESAGKNLFFSPYSVSTAFSMLMAGARGNTASQLASALHLAGPQQDAQTEIAALHEGVTSLRNRLNQSTAAEGFQLYSANGIWVDKTFSPASSFKKTLADVYGTKDLPSLDFRSNPRAAADAINAWGSEQTKGKIKQMVADIPASTSMVLANTVYLKATWFKPFEPGDTKEGVFHVDRDPSHDVRVPLMSQWTDDNNPYMETDDFQMTLLWCGYWKHEGNELNPVVPALMLIVLPKQADGLAQVEKSLTWKKLDQHTDAFGKAMVHMVLPKFKMNAELNLQQLMGRLGATDVFDPAKADLGNIASGSAPLHVSAALQKAFVVANEEGIEAGAETMSLAAGGGPDKRAEFIADHPFLFYIIHRETNAILFMGRVVNPLSGE